MCGLSMAASMRAVICAESMRSLEWTLATTTSSSRQEVEVLVE